MLQRTLLILALLLIDSSHMTAGQTDAKDVASIEEYIRDIMESEGMLGMGVAVVKEGRPLLAEGYGIKDVITGGDVTNETLWYFASTGKAINAALVSKVLSEDGRYTFDTRVREIYPDFTLGTGYRSEHTTMRDILGHRAGVFDSTMGILAGAVPSREAYIEGARFWPLTTFRDRESYNNLMVTVGGEVAAMLSGSASWEDAVRDQLLYPLGMTQTTFVDRLTAEEYDQMATPHFDDGGAPRRISKEIFGPQISAASPSGGLVTSATDVQKWLLFLANKGVTEEGTRVMNASDLMRTMTETSLAKYPPPGEDPEDEIVYAETGVALGWYNGLYRGFNMVTHAGFFFGFESKVTVLPDIGMAVYTNINSPDGYGNGSVQFRVHSHVLDTLLGVTAGERAPKPPKNYDQETRDRFQMDAPMPEYTLRPPHARNEQYAGVYGSFIFGNMTVMYNATSSELVAEWGTVAVMPLVEIGEDSFLGFPEEPLWFSPPIPVTFNSSDGLVYDQMTVPFLLPQAPPTFVRDLKMSDAPPPPTGNCEEPIFL